MERLLLGLDNDESEPLKMAEDAGLRVTRVVSHAGGRSFSSPGNGHDPAPAHPVVVHA